MSFKKDGLFKVHFNVPGASELLLSVVVFKISCTCKTYKHYGKHKLSVPSLLTLDELQIFLLKQISVTLCIQSLFCLWIFNGTGAINQSTHSIHPFIRPTHKTDNMRRKITCVVPPLSSRTY